jgi:hypothetical protein
MRAGGRFKLCLTGLLALFFWGTGWLHGQAEALVGDSEKTFGLNGSIRTLFFIMDEIEEDPSSGKKHIDALSQTILRLTGAGKPTDSLSYELHWVQSFTLFTQKISGENPLGFGSDGAGSASRYRALNARWDVIEGNRSLSTVFFDRFNVKTSFDWGDVTTGRQAITLGKTFFWNPLDVFFPFDSSQFDRDYKPGVDALRVDIPTGPFSGFNLIGVAGPGIGVLPNGEGGNDPRDVSWYGSALLGRLFANKAGWDFSVQGGKIYGGWHAGAGAVGDVGPVQVRCEAARFLAMESEPLPFPLRGDLVEDHFLTVFGVGRRFENSLSLDFEYLYNGAGDPDDLNTALVRTQFGSSLQLSNHLMGLVARYEFTPLVVGQLSTICSLSDGSTQLQPLATVSLSDEMDLLMGMMFNFGPPPEERAGRVLDIQSEFGTLPNIFFLEWKYYF